MMESILIVEERRRAPETRREHIRQPGEQEDASCSLVISWGIPWKRRRLC
jgi:hypothetical protein